MMFVLWVLFMLACGWAPIGEASEGTKLCAETGTCLLPDDGEGVLLAPVCADLNPEECVGWAKDGECNFNPEFMMKDCKKSCGTCHLNLDDLDRLIIRTRKITDAGGDERFIETSHGISQLVYAGDEDDIVEVFRNMSIYMDEKVFKDPKYEKVKNRCRNKHRECAKWKLRGECNANKLWMDENCAPVCETCLLMDYDYRCPPESNSSLDALKPGDLNRMFERIVTYDHFKQYDPIALSMPHKSVDGEIIDLPWVIVLENFVTEEECDRLIQLGTAKGYEPSTSLREGIEHQKRLSTKRTSRNTWCDKECLHDELTQRVHSRIENLTGIPERNAEHLQLLKYEPGQHCFVHNDYLDYQKDRQMGVRVLTVFLYLSDVEDGGATYFPSLNDIAVQPKKGRAVIWPSVRNDDPHEEDTRTNHGSQSLLKGVKYGANAFIHMRDAKSAYLRNCF